MHQEPSKEIIFNWRKLLYNLKTKTQYNRRKTLTQLKFIIISDVQTLPTSHPGFGARAAATIELAFPC